MLSTDDFNIVDPSLKNEEWALRMVRYLTYNSQSLVWDRNVYNLRSWQNSTYDLTEFRKPYLHLISSTEGGTATPEAAKTNIHIDFTPLGLFEITKNVLGGEIDKQPIHINADCFDPTIVADKEKEFDLLKNKKVIEKQINGLYNGIGVPANYKVGNQGEFESNMNEFEGMGLNPDRPEDVEFFATTFYRHHLETYSSQFINYLNKMNKLNEIQKNHINDMISLKAVSMQTYYNTNNGLPSTKYLRPEIVRYTGNITSNDGNDAISKYWQQPMIVGDFLNMIGDEELSEADYKEIIQFAYIGPAAAPNAMASYIFPNGIFFGLENAPKGYCAWNEFLQFNINVGYIEWKTTDRNEANRYHQKTMKAYFVNNLTIPYKLFKFGYLNVMSREGHESELSCFSIQTYRMAGPSMLEICIPYFKMIFSTWLKIQWFLKSAKPMGMAHNITSLRAVAQEIISAGGNFNDALAVIKMFKETPDLIYSYGDLNSERMVGGDGLPYQVLQNGLDPSTKSFVELVQWCKQQITEETGLNNARIAQTPSSEEPNRTTQLVYDQSTSATEYLNSALASLYEGSAYRTFFTIQAITEFNLYGIDQLKEIFGDIYIKAVKWMKKIPIIYFGITFKRLFRDQDREELKIITMQALSNKEISGEIAMIINGIDEPKKAAAVLSYYKERTRKQAIEEQLRITKAQQENIAAQHQGKMEELQLSGQIEMALEKEITARAIEVAKISGGLKIEQQDRRLKTQPLINEQRSNLKKNEQTHDAALKATTDIITKDDSSQE